ncbi:MAG: MarR family transcriptional regulator [Xenophilus sp.]
MELEDHLFFLCTQVVYRRSRAIHEALKPLALSETEFRVLSAALRKGPLSMHDLAQWTAYERTRLTHILHGLEARGLVERTGSASDRRSVLVRITPAGRRLFERAKKTVDAITDEVMSDSTPEEIEQARTVLRTLRRRLIAMQDGQGLA